jgi:hypothetical protein
VLREAYFVFAEDSGSRILHDFLEFRRASSPFKIPVKKGHNPVCPFCEQHTRGVRRAYFNSASTMTCSSELFIANSDSSLLFGN